jgi:hypothetical protein
VASFVQSKGAQATGATLVSVSLTGVVAGNHLSTVTTTDTSATVNATTSSPSATWNTAVASFQVAATDHRFGAHYSENVASGAWTVTGHSSVSCNLTTAVTESTGVATSGSLGLTQTGTSTTTTVSPSASLTPTANSILIAGVADRGSSGNSTADTISSTGNTPFTVDQAGGTGTVWDEAKSVCGSAHFNSAAAVATNVTWTTTHTVTGQAAVLIEYKAAAGAAARQQTLSLLGAGV